MDDLSLLFKLRADNAQAKSALAETRAAVSQLRGSFGSDLAAMQSASKSALSEIGEHVNVFVGERIPLVGGAFLRVTENLHGLHDEMKRGGPEVEKLAKSIESIAQSTGKSTHEITSFLTGFVQIESQAKRDTVAIETFGAAAAQKLIPQLEKAGEELSAVAVSSESAGAGIMAMAGPVGIAVIALVAIGAAAGVIVKEFFELAKVSSEWQGKLFDLSQQVGVSVETLSALEILAKTTGGSIETITASLGIFQKHLESAQDPTSKEAKLLKDLGIETVNTEEALRQALTRLAAMPEGFKQTAAALELFGRGGKSLLAILKEMHGDLDGAIAKFREMGILVSTEDAKAADEFNDQLAMLGFQVRSLTAQITQDSLPAILDALKEFSAAIKDNRQAIHEIGQAISILARVVAFELRGALLLVTSIWNDFINPLRVATELYERMANAVSRIKAPELPSFGADASATTERPSKAGGGASSGSVGDAAKAAEKAAKEAHERLNKSISTQEQELEERTREHRETLERERRLDLKNLEEYVNESTLASQGHFKEQSDLLDQEEGSARKYVKNQVELSTALLAIQRKKEKATFDHAAELQKINEDAQKKRDQSERELETQLLAIRDAQREGELNRISDSLGRQEITESEAITRRQALYEQAYNDRKLLLDIELKQLSTSADRKIAIDNEKIKSEQKYTDDFKRLTNERIDAMAREDVARENLRVRELSEKGSAKLSGAAANQGAGEPPVMKYTKSTLSSFAQLSAAINKNLSGATLTAATAGLQAMTDVFSGLGQAVGNVVEAFVLYGSAGASVQQVTAQILASLAAQAAAKAVFELAEGFAALAMAFFGIPNAGPSATAHFQAAAIYGAIAGIAAVSGRAVAGNSFSQGGGASGNRGTGNSSGGGSGGTGGGNTNGSPAITDINRRVGGTTAPGNYAHVIEFKVRGVEMVNEFVRDYQLNGKTRIVITSDGKLAG